MGPYIEAGFGVGGRNLDFGDGGDVFFKFGGDIDIGPYRDAMNVSVDAGQTRSHDIMNGKTDAPCGEEWWCAAWGNCNGPRHPDRCQP